MCEGHGVIVTEIRCAAAPGTVHELLVDVDAWELWSPHVARVDAPARRIGDGWAGGTRAFFAPVATPMVIDEVRDGGGYSWHSTLGPWRLDYDNAVRPDDDGSVIRFEARLVGPGAGRLERIVAPLSARGQRRRMRRLAHLAELVDGRAG
jgi:hypothetical protein